MNRKGGIKIAYVNTILLLVHDWAPFPPTHIKVFVWITVWLLSAPTLQCSRCFTSACDFATDVCFPSSSVPVQLPSLPAQDLLSARLVNRREQYYRRSPLLAEGFSQAGFEPTTIKNRRVVSLQLSHATWQDVGSWFQARYNWIIFSVLKYSFHSVSKFWGKFWCIRRYQRGITKETFSCQY